MALTAVTTLDVIGQTQTITFNNPTQVDQITFASGAITWQSTAGYSLVKSDYALFQKYIQVFNSLLFPNFPTVCSSVFSPWPIPGTEFLINSTTPPNRIIYTQNSSGTQVLNASYLPVATVVTIAARAAPVTITLQEWFSSVDVLNQFAAQVAAN
jgi:hypothetical protein